MAALNKMELEESPSIDNHMSTSTSTTTTTTTTYHSPLPLISSPEGLSSNYESTAPTSAATAAPVRNVARGPPEDSSSSVQVAVRVRPMLPSEAGSATCIEVLHQQHHRQPSSPSVVRIGGSSGPTFTFDEAFSSTSTQEQVFEHRVVPLLRNCLEGYNATIVAYGQTGSGKTFTIMGPPSSSPLEADEAQMGIIPRALRYLFDELDVIVRQQQPQVVVEGDNGDVDEQNENDHDGDDDDDDECVVVKRTKASSKTTTTTNSTTTSCPKLEYDVRVQFLELYGEEIRDLLTPNNPTSSDRLVIRDVGMEEPEVMGASQQKVSTAEEALLCLTRGMLRRVTGATAMNSSSSRSHAILSVLVEQSITMVDETIHGTGASSGNDGAGGAAVATGDNVQVKRSKFNFVDLAGSERQKRTQAEGQRLKEGIDINKGLLVLGNVISALGDPTKRGKSNFVPYRDSKLTRLLKGSLGGNHKTLMIACVSPSSNNMEESLNCLRYANRAKNIQNHAVVNVDTNTRLLSELKGQVQSLASDLLRARHGDLSGSVFTNDMLQAMSSGGSGVMGATPTNTSSYTPAKSFSNPKRTSWTPERDENCPPSISSSAHADEVNRIRHLLKQSLADLKEREEQLSVSRAENELQRLQLAALMGGTASSSSSSPTSSSSTSGSLEKDLFLQKAKEYEKEIASLKNQIRTVQRNATANAIWNNGHDENDAMHVDDVLIKASKEVEVERAQLSDLHNSISSSPRGRQHHRLLLPQQPQPQQQQQDADETLSHTDNLEAEEISEHAEVSALTSKYIGDLDLEEEVEASNVTDASDQAVIASDEQMDELDISGRRRQQQLEAHLIELSHRIDAKEELIQQLQVSQERYASMRAFYEDKLRQMEEQVVAREREREQLVEELKRLVESNSCTKDLEIRLQDKEQHIAELRKRQRELTDFTRVSSRNESEIQRLRQDVIDMKQRKVDLQKQVNHERKQHATEIQRLKKAAMQKESELNKWKKTSSQWESQTQKAQQIAKVRMEQLGQLRAKYKDAEKKLRMFSVKRGVMAKAGLDPVLVGRREPRKATTNTNAPVSKESNHQASSSPTTGDVDAMRDFFDQEVARISQQEALIDKLANEWEGHLELVLKREELMLQAAERGDSMASEEIEGLDLQRRYKEGRIRQMVRRLGQKRGKPTNSADAKQPDSFLNEADILKFFPGSSPLAATKMAAKVLFGMVVRERRRVAALARTASSLDEKSQQAEQAAAANEAAFRSYMEEKRDELASMTQNHQEQILSLMTMLREESEPGLAPQNDSKIAVFANERISALESQLRELRGEQEAKNMYKLQHEETTRALKAKTVECEELQKKVNHLRAAIRQIRDAVVRRNKGSMTKSPARSPDKCADAELEGDQLGLWIIGILTDALHGKPPKPEESNASRRNSHDSFDSGAGGTPQTAKSSPPLVRTVGRTHSSESDVSDELPDWAGDIMADLEFIAQGKVPPSLRDSPSIQNAEQELEKGAVFFRLADSGISAGPQKQEKSSGSPNIKGTRPKPEGNHFLAQTKHKTSTRSNDKRPEKPVVSTRSPRRPKGRGSAISIATADNTAPKVSPELAPALKSKERRSVFERLLSPSSYTGTHKGKAMRSQLQIHNHHLQQQQNLPQDQPLQLQQQNQLPAAPMIQQQPQDHLVPPPIINRERIEVSHFINKHDDLLDELLASSDDAHSSRYNSDAEHGRTSGSKVADYTQQNVFERLQKTTTQSYEVKKNPTSSRHHTESNHSSPTHSSVVQAPPPALANEPTLITQRSRESLRENLSPQENSSTYTSVNVFERLQKTTTQAYAQKQQPQVEHNPVVTNK